MSEHVNIHIYGNCGAPCPGDSPLGCLQYLARSENTHLDLTSQTSNLMPWPHPYTSHFFMYYSSNIFQSVPSVSFPMRIQPLAPVDLLINLRQLTYHYSTSIFISFLFAKLHCSVYSIITFLNSVSTIAYFASAKLMPIYT